MCKQIHIDFQPQPILFITISQNFHLKLWKYKMESFSNNKVHFKTLVAVTQRRTRKIKTISPASCQALSFSPHDLLYFLIQTECCHCLVWNFLDVLLDWKENYISGFSDRKSQMQLIYL